MLILNCGSSSVKAAVFAKGTLERVASEHLKFDGVDKDAREKKMEEAIVELLKKHDPVMVVHRVVHGGDYREPQVIGSEVLDRIKALCEFAPLHNPVSLRAIEIVQKAAPNLKQAACFDTSFHRDIPQANKLYAIPAELGSKYHIERYGFHGINCAYVVETLQEILASTGDGIDGSAEPLGGRTLICHLGAGSSLSAVLDGKSVCNTMGFTPLDGLVMGTRPGAIDAGVVLYIMKKLRLDSDSALEYLNNECGLMGLAGTSDLKKIEESAKQGDAGASLALEVYNQRLKMQAGAMIALMDGVDNIVFTGGVGENSAAVRKALCDGLNHLGVIIGENQNRDKNLRISTAQSRVGVYIIAADEELAMARDTKRFLD